jgi:hypothetical protein
MIVLVVVVAAVILVGDVCFLWFRFRGLMEVRSLLSAEKVVCL